MSKTPSLFLERSKGETVIIGESPNEVVLEVTRIREHNVTLTFKAPRSIRIDRGERRINKENNQ